ncbi:MULTISPECIES: hypothetical protein [unclassified Bacillus (in: firmicutes)]|uniref:hypothetical protein n=1 Tax=unclassified Bacillus (in: firmicutes) TaxID=185979 RepID=UPI00178C1C26|nr:MULTISPECIES: hypothetical protein [unclassified Bacillus (in: firmicutes)]
MKSQLSFDDILGTFDYKAKSTAEQFLAKPREWLGRDTGKYRLLTYTFQTDLLKKLWS